MPRSVSYLTMIIKEQHTTGAEMSFPDLLQQHSTVKATVDWWKEVSAAQLLCHIQCIISVWRWKGRVCCWEYYRDTCVLPSFGLAMGSGLYTDVQLISDADRGERAWKQAAKGQDIKYSSHSYFTTNQLSSATLSRLSDPVLFWCNLSCCELYTYTFGNGRCSSN